MQPFANYHTHTPRCMHATGTEEEYIRAALQTGFQVLGFADHSPWAFASDYTSRIRMLPDELPGYVQTLRALRQKYAGQLKLYIGLEAEYFPAYQGWLAEQVDAFGLDYLILGNHFDTTEEDRIYFGVNRTVSGMLRYTELTIKGMETGMYRYLAHPDLFLNEYEQFDENAAAACRTLCEAAAALRIPLEYNMLGRDRIAKPHTGLGYTTPEFWRIAAEYSVQAILGCDAHAPAELNRAEELKQVEAELTALGIPVLDRLPGLE